MFRIEGWIAVIFFIGQLEPLLKANDPEPVGFLQLAAAKIVERAAHLPKLYCTQQIMRAQYLVHYPKAEKSACSLAIPGDPVSRNASWQVVWTDRMHVDVAIFADRELFGWPGSGEFAAKDPSQLIGTGAGGSGGFGSFLLSIFGTNGATFRFREKLTFAGHPVYRYDYTVPVESSGYQVRTGKSSVATGYGGEVLIDLAAMTVDQLTVNVDSAPSGSNLCKIAQKIQYHQVRLYDSTFLLPSNSAISHLDDSGVLYESQAEYSACREFSAESSLSFESSDGARPVQSKTPSQTLPPSLPVDIQILTAIDFEKNSAGDTVIGKLMHPVEYKGRVLVPRNAIIRGRIAGLEHTLKPHEFFTLALTFHSYELKDGSSGSFSLKPSSYQAHPQIQNGVHAFVINTGKEKLSPKELEVYALTLAQ